MVCVSLDTDDDRIGSGPNLFTKEALSASSTLRHAITDKGPCHEHGMLTTVLSNETGLACHTGNYSVR